jgi:hypothetical protein
VPVYNGSTPTANVRFPKISNPRPIPAFQRITFEARESFYQV